MLSFPFLVSRTQTVSWVAVVLLSSSMFGQTSERVRSQQDPQPGNRMTELSDLAKDNLSHVAASSPEIKAVLARDTGLLVELKRWVAKEATDNGQVVEDANLSDQAIFDRLDRDVAFRSVATTLVQRYGYLLPAPNPESSFAKEQDLILQARAHRLVQIEAQDDELLKASRSDQQQDIERTGTCVPQRDGDCEKTDTGTRPSNRPIENEPSGIEPSIPNTTPPYLPDMQPPSTPTRTLRTGLSNDDSGLRDQSSSIGLASSSYPSRSGFSLISPTSLSSLSSTGFTGTAPEELAAALISSSYSKRSNSQELTAKNEIPSPSTRQYWKRPRIIERSEDLSPVK